jgi:tyrosinase
MANGVAIRKNVDNLSRPELRVLRNAYAAIKQISDSGGYDYWAGFHGTPGNYCWHDSQALSSGVMGNLFLPWHRAYILYLELALRDQNPNTALPWWDWTLGQAVPKAFSDETVAGNPNPLYRAHINILDRNTFRFPGQGIRTDTTRLPTPGEVKALYSIPNYKDFSDALQQIHNAIHMWTGGRSGRRRGDMQKQATAAYDPIFWSHHAMVDRVWYLWQLKNGVNNIPRGYLSEILTPFRLTVSDVLDISALGVEYAVASATIGA